MSHDTRITEKNIEMAAEIVHVGGRWEIYITLPEWIHRDIESDNTSKTETRIYIQSKQLKVEGDTYTSTSKIMANVMIVTRP